jgi:hypothetical protein
MALRCVIKFEHHPQDESEGMHAHSSDDECSRDLNIKKYYQVGEQLFDRVAILRHDAEDRIILMMNFVVFIK